MRVLSKDPPRVVLIRPHYVSPEINTVWSVNSPCGF